MPKIRISGKVFGENDPKRLERADLLYHLFASGWDIYNSNGDQTIKLENIQEKILEADAFVFTPSPNIEDYFNLASVIVGLQTNDAELKGKPALVLNQDGSWDSFLNLINHLHKLGTVSKPYEGYVTEVKNRDELIKHLTERKKFLSDAKHLHISEPDIIKSNDSEYKEGDTNIKMPDFNICVFCSASIKKQQYLDEGYEIGKIIANSGFGCISGAGKTGIMGQVVKGAVENKGWSGGSNVPHIISMEGLPNGLNEFWPRGDIYTRMEVMIDKSQAFIIMPGGMGTVQELLALLVLKHQKNDLMRDKKIVVYNKTDAETGLKFWQPILDIISLQNSFINELVVVEEFNSLIENCR